MRGELRALKQHILQLEVEAGGVRHTALRREFNAKLGEKRREALRAQNLVGGGGEDDKKDSERKKELQGNKYKQKQEEAEQAKRELEVEITSDTVVDGEIGN